VHIAKSELESKIESLVSKDHFADSLSSHLVAIRNTRESLDSMDKRMESRITVLDEKMNDLGRKVDHLTINSERNSEALSQVHRLTFLILILISSAEF
jgi:predicted  nucleic acid-binding Zn-ribbon protein